ncbi:hypothetical protein KsCSTR_27730 [Candidatus Kuenenia stuttgartiensis]|uniref:Uncharacterized protein n=1 Tax=Kuenenia stuttgartiensis TaxID=174633 RepID=Q1Q0P9_KUEST|nr:hypothetical protein KsCSTR_27730 [Candidatus Kuenenia stuttgartiensis]TVM01173.1 MAG: hypothetical protein CV080_05680 [Candidatus Kuenenia stuttgartiensis]CAJ73571.1 unknown protein [Candidatus Kuenenia stuttgartiensis]
MRFIIESIKRKLLYRVYPPFWQDAQYYTCFIYFDAIHVPHAVWLEIWRGSKAKNIARHLSIKSDK